MWSKFTVNTKTTMFLGTHAKATPVATATALPPELPPAIYQSETSASVSDVVSSLRQTV